MQFKCLNEPDFTHPAYEIFKPGRRLPHFAAEMKVKAPAALFKAAYRCSSITEP